MPKVIYTRELPPPHRINMMVWQPMENGEGYLSPEMSEEEAKGYLATPYYKPFLEDVAPAPEVAPVQAPPKAAKAPAKKATTKAKGDK
ncbi:hypothetical protein H8U31_001333 [Salmonella enterica]|nr:hypothetical protein [Salmonella enterica]